MCDCHEQIMSITTYVSFIWSLELNELLIELRKLLLTLECNADVAN